MKKVLQTNVLMGLTEFHVKIVQTPKEIKGLLEVGFEYICEKDGLLFFRKRK